MLYLYGGDATRLLSCLVLMSLIVGLVWLFARLPILHKMQRCMSRSWAADQASSNQKPRCSDTCFLDIYRCVVCFADAEIDGNVHDRGVILLVLCETHALLVSGARIPVYIEGVECCGRPC